MSEFVSICEVGPRDGLQIAKTRMTTDDKVRWIAAIAAAGVREIEVGSFVPPRVIPQLADTPEIVARVLAMLPGLTVQALAPNLRGVQNAYNAGVHKISMPISVSEGHSRANLNRTPAESIVMMREVMDWLHAQPRKVPVVAGASTAFGCSIDGVVTDGADRGDVQGPRRRRRGSRSCWRTPSATRIRRRSRKSCAPRARRSARCCTACICTTPAASASPTRWPGWRRASARSIPAWPGLGGCPYAPGASGNVVTEDLVFMLESMGFSTGIDLEKLLEARAVLHAGLPAEPLHGQLPKAGIPPTFRKAA